MSDKLERKDIDRSKIDWNEHAEYWDDFKDARLYTDQTFALLKERIDLTDLTILDFGCGTGILTEHMATMAKQIVAIDSSDKMIEVLNGKQLNNVEGIVAELSEETVNKYPVLKNKFDLIVASSVCAFVPNLDEVLSVIRSLLKPNGIFVQWDWLKAAEDENFGFTEDMIRNDYVRVGLKVDSVDVAFHFVENEEKMEVLMAVGTP